MLLWLRHGYNLYLNGEWYFAGMLADGRCLFRALAHGACMKSGEEVPDENQQRELADELRAQVQNGVSFDNNCQT